MPIQAGINQQGFTLIEILLVMSLIAVLYSLTTVNVLRPQAAASVDSLAGSLAADIKSQQLISMAGYAGSDATPEPNGLFIESDRYTLFKDATYSAGSPDNFVVEIPNGVALSGTLPSAQLVFDQGSGDVSGFVDGSNTISVSGSGDSVTITINRYGALTVN